MPIQYSAASDEKPRQLVSYVMLIIHKFYKRIFHSTIQGFKESIEQYRVRDRPLQNPTQHISSVCRLTPESSFAQKFSLGLQQ